MCILSYVHVVGKKGKNTSFVGLCTCRPLQKVCRSQHRVMPSEQAVIITTKRSTWITVYRHLVSQLNGKAIVIRMKKVWHEILTMLWSRNMQTCGFCICSNDIEVFIRPPQHKRPNLLLENVPPVDLPWCLTYPLHLEGLQMDIKTWERLKF